MLEAQGSQESTVIGSCNDDFVAKAMQIAAGCGVQPQPSPSSCQMPYREGTIGSAITTLTQAATTTVTITVRKGTFVGQRLIISKGSAVGDLLVTDVRVGGQSIMLSSDPIGCELTDPANFPGGVALPFLPAPVSQTIEVDVKNTTNGNISRTVQIKGVMF